MFSPPFLFFAFPCSILSFHVIDSFTHLRNSGILLSFCLRLIAFPCSLTLIASLLPPSNRLPHHFLFHSLNHLPLISFIFANYFLLMHSLTLAASVHTLDTPPPSLHLLLPLGNYAMYSSIPETRVCAAFLPRFAFLCCFIFVFWSSSRRPAFLGSLFAKGVLFALP